MKKFDWEAFEAELDEQNEDDTEEWTAEYYESLGITCDSLGNPIRRISDRPPWEEC